MKLEKIALITNNDRLARFFELELTLLPYELNIFSTVTMLDAKYDCIVIDSDTVEDIVSGSVCPVITVSSRFDSRDIFPQSRTCTLPWPVSICEIGKVLRAIELDVFDESTAENHSGRAYNTVYVVDRDTNSVMVENLHLRLTPSEFAVLEVLCASSGKLVERGQISELLGAPDSNIVDVYICRLRKKLEVPLNRKVIFAERGRGYRTILTIKK